MADRVAELYPTVAPELGRYLRRLGVAATDSEDLVSEVFSIVLSLDAAGGERVKELRPYMFGIAHNLGMRMLRSRSTEHVAPNEDLDQAVTVPDEAAQRESAVLARHAFRKLPELERRILWLTMVERRSAAEVGADVGLTATNVNTRAQRARARLREGYLSGFLEKTPPACGTPVSLIAQHVGGTMGRRDQKKFRSHAQACSHCNALIQHSRSELDSGSMLGLVLIGGVTLALITGASAPAPASASSSPSGRKRLLATAAGALVAAVAVAAATVTPVIGTGETPADTREDTVTPSSARRIVATPAAVEIVMPAPGHASSWTSRVTNRSESPTELYLLVGHSGDADGVTSELTVTVHVNGVLMVDHASMAGFDNHPTRLGSLAPGESVDVDGQVDRDRRGTRQKTNLAFVTRYVSADAGIDALGTGMPDVLTLSPPWGLAETGDTAPSWLVLTSTSLGLSGAVLLLVARRRAHPSGGEDAGTRAYRNQQTPFTTREGGPWATAAERHPEAG